MTAATVSKAKSASTRKKAETNSSKKLKARRAVEDHLERLRLEKENNDYCFDF